VRLLLDTHVLLWWLAEEPLEAGVRIWYVAEDYSFPLRYERGRFCSWYDGQVVDLEVGDPHLLYVSVSTVKEPELGVIERPLPPGLRNEQRAGGSKNPAGWNAPQPAGRVAVLLCAAGAD